MRRVARYTTKMEEGNEVVLVTGASGCLGHHVLKLLISSDNNVQEIRCLDLVEPEELMKKAIEEEQEKLVSRRRGRGKKISWFIGDIRDVNVVERVVAYGSVDSDREPARANDCSSSTQEDYIAIPTTVDCIIHCAAKVDIWKETNEQDVAELESVNVNGTENLLKAAIRFGCSKFIHVSSFEVYSGIETLYYCTESTLPDTKWFLFGASGSTKKDAENKVRHYSKNKLEREARNGRDSLNAIIVRFPTIYGEFDKHFVSKWLKVTKSLGGKLRRLDNIWIRQQPIYAANAAWSLIKANQRMNHDLSISGEEFHVTDETDIQDSFDFLKPFVEAKGMQVTERSYPFWLVFATIYLFFIFRRLLNALDFFGLFTNKKNRLQKAIEEDKKKSTKNKEQNSQDTNSTGINENVQTSKPLFCFGYLTPQMLLFTCTTSFLNRTKASLRLDYDPIVDSTESFNRSFTWYKNHLKL